MVHLKTHSEASIEPGSGVGNQGKPRNTGVGRRLGYHPGFFSSASFCASLMRPQDWACSLNKFSVMVAALVCEGAKLEVAWHPEGKSFALCPFTVFELVPGSGLCGQDHALGRG